MPCAATNDADVLNKSAHALLFGTLHGHTSWHYDLSCDEAEHVLNAMDMALEKLRTEGNRQPRDLTALQEGWHSARQQGLQIHPVYNEAEMIFAGV